MQNTIFVTSRIFGVEPSFLSLSAASWRRLFTGSKTAIPFPTLRENRNGITAGLDYSPLFRLVRVIVTAVCLFVAGTVNAFELGEVEFHGFLTAGATVSDSDNATYLAGITDETTFQEDLVFGLQVGTQIADELRLDGQIIAGGTSFEDDIEARLDWAFLTYEFNENFALRAGKIRFPLQMLSEVVEVGYSYSWIRPPQEPYRIVSGSGIAGMSVLIKGRVGEFEFHFEPYTGSFEDSIDIDFGFGPVPTKFELSEIVGFDANLSNDVITLRAGYFESGFTIGVPLADLTLWSVGIQVDWNDFVLLAENQDTSFDNDISGSLIGAEASYVTLGYRFGDWMPHVTFATMEPDTILPFGFSATQQSQESLTLGVRYEVTSGSALKFEWANVEVQDGTRGLFDVPPLEDDVNVFSVAWDLAF